jgi:hypothetical protein
MHQSPTLLRVTAVLVVAAGIALALVRFGGEPPPGRNLEGALAALAFGAVVAAPGVLALLATHERPMLLLPAAVLLIPLSLLSFALVTLPLLIPAFLLFRAYWQAAPDGSSLRAVGATSGVLIVLVAALVVLFAHQDPRQYVTATGSYGTSDIVTCVEAATSLALTAVALVAGWWLAAPPARPRAIRSLLGARSG